MPRLTVLIPAHNDDYTLSFCLASVAPHVDEVLVLDDCSTDLTADVVLEAARTHPHIQYLRHEGEQQLGWIEARNRLLLRTDSDHLFWIDADDVLAEYNAGLLREIAAESDAHRLPPLVWLHLTELWGDLDHTTGRLRHFDRCHLFVNRRRLRDGVWGGGTAAQLYTDQRVTPGRSAGPLLFHMKGVKPDRRLVERCYVRRWMAGGRPGRLADWPAFGVLNEQAVHRLALRMLFDSRGDPLCRYPAGGPVLPEVLRRAPRRFEVIYRHGKPVDRVDHFPGWTP
jgi:glycosyltransferase involved in cell wall biosynthesis